MERRVYILGRGGQQPPSPKNKTLSASQGAPHLTGSPPHLRGTPLPSEGPSPPPQSPHPAREAASPRRGGLVPPALSLLGSAVLDLPFLSGGGGGGGAGLQPLGLALVGAVLLLLLLVPLPGRRGRHGGGHGTTRAGRRRA